MSNPFEASFRSVSDVLRPDGGRDGTGSEGGASSVGQKEMSDEQKAILRKSRPVMFVMLAFFFGIAFHNEGRLYLCMLQLLSMAVIGMCWSEERILNVESAMTIRQTCVGLMCQCLAVSVPLVACASIGFALSTQTDDDFEIVNDPV